MTFLSIQDYENLDGPAESAVRSRSGRCRSDPRHPWPFQVRSPRVADTTARADPAPSARSPVHDLRSVVRMVEELPHWLRASRGVQPCKPPSGRVSFQSQRAGRPLTCKRAEPSPVQASANHMDIQITTKKSEGVERLLEVSVPLAAVNAEEERTARRYASSVRLPGFRPGKAPPAMVRKRFKDAIRQQVLETLVQEAFK